MHKLRIFGIFAALALLIAACGGPTTPPGTHVLTVSITGEGNVYFDEVGGDNAEGTNNIAAGTEVTLVADPGTNQKFDEWTGDVCVNEGATCTFLMDGDKSVTATFTAEDLPAEVPMSVEFSNDSLGGTVTATGINCTFDPASPDPAGPDCSEDAVSTSTPMSLTAAPTDAGMSVQWVGIADCADGATECEVTPNANPFVVTVRFFDPSGPEVLEGTVAIADGTDDGLEWITDANNVDDNPENAQGNTHTTLDYMGLGYTARWQAETAGGFLFRNVNIPAGANITEAYIQFTSIVATSGSCPTSGCMDAGDSAVANLIVKAVAAVAPADIPDKDDSAPLLTRSFVTSTAEWTVPEWESKGERGPLQLTGNLKDVLQDVIDLAGWGVDGNDVLFVIQNNDADAAEGYRQIATADEGTDVAPELIFKYTLP